MGSGAGQRHHVLGLFDEKLVGLRRQHTHIGMLAGQDAAAGIAHATAQVGLCRTAQGQGQAQGRAALAHAIGSVEEQGVGETA